MKTAEEIFKQFHTYAEFDLIPDKASCLKAMQEYAQQIASLAWDEGRVYGAKDFIDKNKLQQRFLWAGEQPPTKEQFLNSIFNNQQETK